MIPDQNKRLSLEEIMNHPWIVEIKSESNNISDFIKNSHIKFLNTLKEQLLLSSHSS